MPSTIKPSTAIIGVLLVVCLVLRIMLQAAAADRDKARAELPRIQESLRQMEASTKEVNAAIDALAKQGRELSSQVAQSSAHAEGVQRDAELKAQALMHTSHVVPADPAGALGWAHTVTAAAAREFAAEASK